MKNNLPKIFLIAVIGILVFPQVSFAAWWNPLTWFKKPVTPEKAVQIKVDAALATSISVTTTTPKAAGETTVVKPKMTPQVKSADQSAEVEKLKKEVAELKKTIPAGAFPKPLTPLVSSHVPIKSQSRQEDEKIYRDYLIGYLNFPIALYANDKAYAEKNISRVEDAIQFAKKNKATFTGLIDSNPNNIGGVGTELNYLIELYNNEIQYYKKTLSNLNNIIIKIDAGLKLLAEEKTRMLLLSFTKEQVTEETKRIDNYYNPKISSVGDEISAVVNNLVKYHNDKRNEYEELFAYLKGRLGRSALPDVTVKILTP